MKRTTPISCGTSGSLASRFGSRRPPRGTETEWGRAETACVRSLEGIAPVSASSTVDSCIVGCRDERSGVPSAKVAATQTRVSESATPRSAPPARSRASELAPSIFSCRKPLAARARMSPSTAKATMLASVITEPKTGLRRRPGAQDDLDPGPHRRPHHARECAREEARTETSPDEKNDEQHDKKI